MLEQLYWALLEKYSATKIIRHEFDIAFDRSVYEIKRADFIKTNFELGSRENYYDLYKAQMQPTLTHRNFDFDEIVSNTNADPKLLEDVGLTKSVVEKAIKHLNYECYLVSDNSALWRNGLYVANHS